MSTIKEEAIKLRNNIDAVYEAGQQSEYDRFWDNYQQNGSRTHYFFGFAGHGWNSETFKPKYDIKPTTSYYTFGLNQYNGDLVELLEKQGVILDTSNSTECDFLFASSLFTRIGIIDLSKIANCNHNFRLCPNLTVIEKVILKADGSQKFSSTFANSPKLEEIRFEGVIGQNGLNLQWSPLSHETLTSIIDCLADKSADTSGTVWTVTLGSTNIAKLTAAEYQLIINKGWNVA